jgi:hypothetical protein
MSTKSVGSPVEIECGASWSEPIGDYEAGSPSAPARPQSDSIESLAATSVGTYEGEVIAAAPGFGAGNPGLLLRVKVTRVLKRSPLIRSDDDLLVFHDYARFGAGQYSFCVGYRPVTVGDRVLIIVTHPPLDQPQQVIFASNGLFIEHAGKVLAPPPFKRQDAVAGAKDLAAIAERAERGVRRVH